MLSTSGASMTDSLGTEQNMESFAFMFASTGFSERQTSTSGAMPISRSF